VQEEDHWVYDVVPAGHNCPKKFFNDE
jgi:hypothetical protein